MDIILIQLRGKLRRGNQEDREKAFQQLIELAEEEGMKWGTNVSNKEKLHLFSMSPPKGYATNQLMQLTNPSYDFYHWKEDQKGQLREAFFRGYEQTLNTRCNRSFTLPLDPEGPYFGHPCADMIRDELEIVRGKRDPQVTDDAIMWRARIAFSARQNAR